MQEKTRVNLKLPEGEHKKLRKWAIDKDVSLQELVSKIVLDWIAENIDNTEGKAKK